MFTVILNAKNWIGTGYFNFVNKMNENHPAICFVDCRKQSKLFARAVPTR
jgi:hypothetical protein